MRIIHEGNIDTEYVFDCDICKCVFAITTKEFADSNCWGVRCPCCNNLIGKNLAFKDEKGRYKNDSETINDKHKRRNDKETLKTEIRGDPIVKKFT